MKRAASFDYVAAGHVTVDLLPGGERRPGGGAFYSALQAARLGRRALIITSGRPDELEQLLAPYRSELALDVRPARHTTTLLTSGSGRARRQRLLAWAGPLPDLGALDTAILHLAPVAREDTVRWRGRAEFVGLTPQGLVRRWSGPPGELEPASLAAQALPGRCDAIVLSESERSSCAALLEDPAARAFPRATVAITAGGAASTLLLPEGERVLVEPHAHVQALDDLGAGDVFAAAFFIALQEGRPPRRACELAAAAAAVRIAGRGPGAVGDSDAVKALLRAPAS